MEDPAAPAPAEFEVPVHDIRNQLTIVLGFVQICLDADAEGRPPERRFLEGILNATSKASAMLRPGSEPVAGSCG